MSCNITRHHGADWKLELEAEVEVEAGEEAEGVPLTRGVMVPPEPSAPFPLHVPNTLTLPITFSVISLPREHSTPSMSTCAKT